MEINAKYIKGNIQDRIEIEGDTKDLERLVDFLEDKGITVNTKKIREGWRL